ncbi:hypothetical protein, partial [Xanthomonas translucens]|uniref:hypothetical protein n=2 Tax=Xanthomonas campestris pv. translucens TaxID=343 RepID=UPI00210C29E8
PQPAHRFQLQWSHRLQRRTWHVAWEVPMQLERNRQGVIDLVVSNGRWTVAIELDNRTPRKKSIRKLTVFPCARAYVICRSGLIHRVK